MKNRFSELRPSSHPTGAVGFCTQLAAMIGIGVALAAGSAPSAKAEAPEVLAQAGPSAPTNEPTDATGAPAPTPAVKPAPPPPTSGIEEIVVEGTESEAANDFETADSVTGFGAEDLAALGASDISDLAAFTPNLEIVTAGATTPTFFIRGVGLNDFNSNSTGAVAIYQDDIPINAPALQLGTLFDTEAVNVLRGPQGTGLARNASAGAIKVYTRKPSGEFGGFLRSEIGNYNAKDFEGAFESPIYEDVVAGRFAFRFTDRDGTMKNRCGNAIPFSQRTPVPNAGGPGGLDAQGKRPTDAPWSICGEPVAQTGDKLSDIPEGLAPFVNNQHNWAARGTLLFQPTLDMNWLVSAHGARRDELSRLGQSIGTRGFTCKDGDIANCGYPGQSSTSRIDGVLGGNQGILVETYVAPEIRARYAELAPCSVSRPGSPSGTCFLAANRAQDNAAKIRMAKELSKRLDSQPWAGDFNLTGPTTNDTYGGYVKGDIALPYGMTLTSATGYDHYDRGILIDLDMSPQTLFQIDTQDNGWQVAQGLQLQGQLGYESPVRWDIGGWFLQEQLNVVVTNDLGPFSGLGVGVRDYTQDLWSSAGYASLAFDFWDDFTLDGGFRYNWEQKKLDYVLESTGCGFVDCTSKLNDTWHAPTGTIRLTYRFREDTHVFWKYTRGWKPGSYNATSSPDTGVSVADPETIDAFETGVRGSWFDGRFGLDTSFFYYSYKDYQIFTAQQFAGGQPEFVIINANSAEVFGAEVDAVVRPWVGAFANVRFGWLETQFLDFVQIQQEVISTPGGLVTVNRELQNTGNPLLNSPRFKVSLTGEQTVPIGRFGTLTARYDGVWTDQTYYDATKGVGLPNVDDVQALPGDTISQPAYWIHNFQLTYRPPSGRMALSGWVRNLTNQSYKTFAFDASTFNDTSIYFIGDPRTYGGTFTVNF